jgi:hypothetical protein
MGYVLSGRLKVARTIAAVSSAPDENGRATRLAMPNLNGIGFDAGYLGGGSRPCPNGDGYRKGRERHPLPGDRKWRFSL